MKSNSPASTKFDSAYLEIAGIIARQSTCVRVKVGAVITVNNRIVSTGYNGVPSGMKHCAEVFSSIKPMSESQFLSSHHEFSSKFKLHAEQNAIAFCAKRGVSVEGGTLYVTITPCQDCLKLS